MEPKTTQPSHSRSDRSRPASVGVPDGHAHAVQFYDDDGFLCAAVADFIAGGLAAGQPAVVIATRPHRETVAGCLTSKGFRVDRLRRDGGLTMLDARETLATFMAGKLPDPRRFRATVGGVIERPLRTTGRAASYLYGEMVDLLWKDGNPQGAIRLEELWNELADTHRFSLLCAYAMGGFSQAGHADHFREICQRHGHVVPTENYTQADDAARLLEVSALQQRARALETEIARRTELERRLRDALAEREALLARERVARAEAEAARVVAEEANRAKADFLAVMSHELRTPLNAIGGYAELLELGVHGPVAEPQRVALERIQRSQRHLSGLINEVLSYARVESGSVRYQIADVPMDEILRAADSLILPQVRAKGLDYACPGCPATLVARADRERVQQILVNLLTNAVKFTERGGRVRVECEAADGAVLVRVRDTGVGIPPEKLEAIFEPFVQIDSALTRTHDGIGLGLAISRNLARGMGGELVAESRVDEGSTFTLTLPRGLS
ncbi:MAG TPA: ATP-binding protein [Gemmatimonadaceae bacterium]|nr:ATP-binding protein [Gemmatimonadaceae bacterium]